MKKSETWVLKINSRYLQSTGLKNFSLHFIPFHHLSPNCTLASFACSRTEVYFGGPKIFWIVSIILCCILILYYFFERFLLCFTNIDLCFKKIVLCFRKRLFCLQIWGTVQSCLGVYPSHVVVVFFLYRWRLCVVATVTLTSLFSLFCATGECYRFLHRGWAHSTVKTLIYRHPREFAIKEAQNSFQHFPRRNVWWVIITTLYQFMLQSWYQTTAQSLVNTLVLFLWHNRLP